MSVNRIKMSTEFASFPFTTLLQPKNSNTNRALICFHPFFCLLPNSKQKKIVNEKLLSNSNYLWTNKSLVESKNSDTWGASQCANSSFFVPKNFYSRSPNFSLLSITSPKISLLHFPLRSNLQQSHGTQKKVIFFSHPTKIHIDSLIFYKSECGHTWK